MKIRKAALGLLFTGLALACAGCSDELSPDDAAWVHQQRLQQLYGSSTATATSVVTVTAVTTDVVTASTTTVY